MLCVKHELIMPFQRSQPVTFLQTARVLEAVGVGAYLGAVRPPSTMTLTLERRVADARAPLDRPQAHLLTDPSLLLAASSIVTLEARHHSLLNVLNGGSFGPQQSFDLPLTPQGVLALAGGFLVGCDASELCVLLSPSCSLSLAVAEADAPSTRAPRRGLTANAALDVVDEATAAARFVPGSKLALSVVGLEVDLSVHTCQLLLGGQPVALTFPASECYVPAGVDGRASPPSFRSPAPRPLTRSRARR